MIQVIKRDNSVVAFDIHKIEAAIQKAFASLNKETDDSIIELLSLRVTSEFSEQIKDGKIPVEQIQDCVEYVLSVTGYADVAKAYILYRKQRENVREFQKVSQVHKKIMDAYLHVDKTLPNDDRLSTYSIGGLILSNSGAITKNYWTHFIYDEQIVQAHEQGDIYIHDLDMLTGDSCGWSIRPLLEHGLSGLNHKIDSRPPKHLFSACNQLINFLGILQNEWAGAQCIPSFDTYLAPFVKVDHLDEKNIQQCIETFIYGVNIPARWGSQAPFSTISFDWTVPEDLKNQKVLIGGVKQNFVYGDCLAEMKMIQKAFFKTLLEADQSGRSFPFPIPNINIKEDFDWQDDDLNALLFEVAAKYGSPYFAHHSRYERETMTDYHRLYEKPSGFFGYGENQGSIGMITINMPRLTHQSKNEQDFFEKLDKLMDLVARTLDVKRQILNQFLQAGLYPYTRHYLNSFDTCFGTFGVIGMNEACEMANWIQSDLGNEQAQDFVVKVLIHMKNRLYLYQEKYHSFFNLEATPGERVSYELVQKDREWLPDNAKSYYTNSANLPVNYTDDVFEALTIQQRFLPLFTGGAAFHVYIPERIVHWQDCMHLVHQMIDHYLVPYFTISPTYSICNKDGYIPGSNSVCPVCNEKVEVWARMAGYYQPIQYWNESKRQEFIERQDYQLA